MTPPASPFPGSAGSVAPGGGSRAREAVLVDVVELTYEEAAAVMGCPVGTVRSRLHRARRRLAGELRELAASYGLAEGGGA